MQFQDPSGKVKTLRVYRLPGAALEGGDVSQKISWECTGEYQNAVFVQRVIIANHRKQDEVIYFTNDTRVFRFATRP